MLILILSYTDAPKNCQEKVTYKDVAIWLPICNVIVYGILLKFKPKY